MPLWFSQIQIWLIQWELHTFRRLPPTAVVSALLASALSVFRTRAALQLEIIALRHQPGILRRSMKKPKLNRFDRFLWAWFYGVCSSWRCRERAKRSSALLGFIYPLTRPCRHLTILDADLRRILMPMTRRRRQHISQPASVSAAGASRVCRPSAYRKYRTVNSSV